MKFSGELAGLSRDGSRLSLRNTFFKPDGRVAAVVTTDAGWLSLDKRHLVIPADKLLSARKHLTRTEEFEDLPSSINRS